MASRHSGCSVAYGDRELTARFAANGQVRGPLRGDCSGERQLVAAVAVEVAPGGLSFYLSPLMWAIAGPTSVRTPGERLTRLGVWR